MSTVYSQMASECMHIYNYISKSVNGEAHGVKCYHLLSLGKGAYGNLLY